MTSEYVDTNIYTGLGGVNPKLIMLVRIRLLYASEIRGGPDELPWLDCVWWCALLGWQCVVVNLYARCCRLLFWALM